MQHILLLFQAFILIIGNPNWLLNYSAKKPLTMDHCQHASPFYVHVWFNGSIHTITREGAKFSNTYATTISLDKGTNLCGLKEKIVQHVQGLYPFLGKYISHIYYRCPYFPIGQFVTYMIVKLESDDDVRRMFSIQTKYGNLPCINLMVSIGHHVWT